VEAAAKGPAVAPNNPPAVTVLGAAGTRENSPNEVPLGS